MCLRRNETRLGDDPGSRGAFLLSTAPRCRGRAGSPEWNGWPGLSVWWGPLRERPVDRSTDVPLQLVGTCPRARAPDRSAARTAARTHGLRPRLDGAPATGCQVTHREPPDR